MSNAQTDTFGETITRVLTQDYATNVEYPKGFWHHCDDPDCHVSGFVTTLPLVNPIEELSEKTDRAILLDLLESHNQILGLIQELKDQVQPMVDSLSKSPVAKMLGVKL